MKEEEEKCHYHHTHHCHDIEQSNFYVVTIIKKAPQHHLKCNHILGNFKATYDADFWNAALFQPNKNNKNSPLKKITVKQPKTIPSKIMVVADHFGYWVTKS